mgnify:CR=1 FL=1
MLAGANLDGADLAGARIRDEQLTQVASMEGAALPDGTRYTSTTPGDDGLPGGLDDEEPVVSEPSPGVDPSDKSIGPVDHAIEPVVGPAVVPASARPAGAGRSPQEAAPTGETDDQEGTINATGDRVEPDTAVPGNLGALP